MINPFPSELRTADTVTRWNIVRTIKTQSIAEHSFFVAIYAYMIAETIGWKGPRDYLLWLALTHDLEEIITADIVAPARKVIVDEDKAEDFIGAQLEKRMPSIMSAWYSIEDRIDAKYDDEAKRIVACADRVEPTLFLTVEGRMGNKMGQLMDYAITGLEGYWRALPAPKDKLDELWQTVVLPSIKEHETVGGRGLV